MHQLQLHTRQLGANLWTISCNSFSFCFSNFFIRTVNDFQWSVFLTVWVLRNWDNFQCLYSFCFEFSALHVPVFPLPWPCSELTSYPLKQRECLVLLDWIIKATQRFGRKSSDCRLYSLGVKLHDSVNANTADSYDQPVWCSTTFLDFRSWAGIHMNCISLTWTGAC